MSNLTFVDRRRSSSTVQATTPTTYKFPDLAADALQAHSDHPAVESRSPSPRPLPLHNNLHSHERWQARRDSRIGHNWGNGSAFAGGSGGARHGRQKSLSEAIRTVRDRKGSVTQNAQEIAEALKAPVSGKLILLCGVWYATSIMSNTSSKAILTAFPKPVTLTLIQFLFVCSWCFILSWLARIHPPLRNAVPALRNGIRRPTREIIITTLPLTAFQIGGHILSSDAMSRIPVSLVHTIKGLSPLFTVLAYRFIFNVHYSYATYGSLVPLTLGVVMACSSTFRGNVLGLIYAFGSAVLFVTQNIVSKKLFNEAAKAEADGIRTKKPDKLNLLCYSTGLAFIITLPIWLWSEGASIIFDFLADASVELSSQPGSLDHGRLALEFIFNGSFHFGQNLVAFVLLGLVSPVTYSVASLIKRVFVIVFAIIWFGNPMTRIQAFGIGLTILGLYLYDRTSDAAKADKRARALQDKDTLLPLTLGVNGDAKKRDEPSPYSPSPYSASPVGYGLGVPGSQQQGAPAPPPTFAQGMFANGGVEKMRQGSNASPGSWLAPGTKAEETWTTEDLARNQHSVGVR